MNYQGLFYLVTGFTIYFLILFILRLLGEKKEKVISNNIDVWKIKEKLKIVNIINESHDVKTFLFKRANGKAFDKFKPGQFLSFQIGDDEKLLRSYSISGSCENTSTLQVSIKLLKDGKGSGWFHELSSLDTVWAYPPGGLFSDDDLAEDIPRVYIGGGIGITPLISMIKTSLDRALNTSMTLYYGMNSTKDLVFHEELALLSIRYKNFSYFPILSPGATGWDGDLGYINLDFIKSKQNLSEESHFYFCGPPIMTDGIVESLKKDHFSVDQIHLEKFASSASFDSESFEEKDVKIKLLNDSFEYKTKNSILEFLEEQGVDIPFACRSGVCGECKCKLIEGEVDSVTDSGLTSKEKSQGYILTCVSRPKTDLKLDI